MKSVSGKHFARILENRVWNLIRVNGNHHVYMQSESSVRIPLQDYAGMAVCSIEIGTNSVQSPVKCQLRQ